MPMILITPLSALPGAIESHAPSHIVTLLSSGRSISCRVNDRGPFVKGRCIDLSTAAALALGLSGIAHVSVQ